MSLTVETLARLRTDAGAALLADAAARIDDDPVRTTAALRAAHSPELVAAALTTVRLRQRAATRLGPMADRMFFTPDGAEQVTRTAVAAHRAARFSGVQRIVDLCCGIGGDLLGFAAAGIAVDAIDADPLTAAVAAANASALGFDGLVSVRCTDALTVDLGGVPAAFCDPARRSGGRRTVDPESYLPPYSYVLELLARVSFAGAKVAPGLDHALIPAEVEAEWVSDRGVLVELSLYSRDLATTTRRATVLPAGASLTGDGEPAPVGPIGDWLYDPDPAVVRAHLVGELASSLGAAVVDPHIAYLTGPRVPTPFAKAYQIQDVVPFSLKKLRSALRTREIGRLTILKRGSAVDVEQLRRDLRLRGPNEAALALTRIAQRPVALICSALD
ncbi:class I SAM-dependent methyltransferase [Fodinicola acaciae]|uniref:class I SAM-dependent methyltransferase n=1 Tax=Fodinicola acaciae TaxID=2681555 RepID=UPI0013D0C94C|nr:DNA cytosine methyltransferase [Fodinicola acaciae]